MRKKELELGFLGLGLILFLSFFLIYPVAYLSFSPFAVSSPVEIAWFLSFFDEPKWWESFKNSLWVSSWAAAISTSLALIVAYTVNMTTLNARIKNTFYIATLFPMLLPTITYGFVIAYTFGRQGLLTQIVGSPIITDIYGFKGLLLGYVIYTLPVTFLIINNAFKYLDRQLIVVSMLMQDSVLKRFQQVLLKPLGLVLVAAFIQAFILSFTDFGIPASLGGRYNVVATYLYQEMLGANPSFMRGSAIALSMLAPSVLAILVLQYLDKFQSKPNHFSEINLPVKTWVNGLCALASTLITGGLIGVFIVMLIVPFVENWPYDLSINVSKARQILADPQLVQTYKNSLLVALMTTLLGTFIAFIAALFTTRSQYPSSIKKIIEAFSLVTNAVPGMVLGIAYLLVFSGTSLQNTLLILVLANVVHFFSTPYLMAKSALSKLSANWETTAALLGDSWIKTLLKVIIPNTRASLIQIMNYLFVNAMVTVSAIIFLTGVHTMVMTTKINELQHFSKFDEVFVLSLLILFSNIVTVIFTQYIGKKRQFKSS